MLGAVRHKSVIPWDDDIDIMMDRKDYNRFVELQETEGSKKYKLITIKNTTKFNYLFSKLVDTNTILIEDHNYRVANMGVFIDIFPLDSFGEKYEEAFKKLKRIHCNIYLGVASNWRHFYINKGHVFFRKLPRFVFFLFSRFTNFKKKYRKIESLFSYKENSNYIGCICSVYGYKDIRKAEVYAEYFDVEFDEKMFMANKQYDSYSRDFYGDYMQLPPVEKRVIHHTFDVYLKK